MQIATLRCERVYPPLCKVADTPFYKQGDEMLHHSSIQSLQNCVRSVISRPKLVYDTSCILTAGTIHVRLVLYHLHHYCAKCVFFVCFKIVATVFGIIKLPRIHF